MLRSLYVRDFALIEALEVEFDSGLNIITGETGAGKSILIGALQMILGERASTDVIRSGARKAVIEGVFDEGNAPELREVLEEHEIDIQPEIILRREISPSQSRGFINDTPATLQVMREVASHLVDLHGQHEHQSLLRVETHLELLDHFGGLQDPLATYMTAYQEVAGLVQERTRLLARKREMDQQKDLFGYQIQEIDRVAPQDGEEEELENERRVLANAERLFESTSRLYSLLYDSDSAVYDRLAEARDELQELVRIDTTFQESLSEIDSARIIVAEIGKFLQRYSAGVEFNPERLESIRGRLVQLESLKRKYGGTLEAVLAQRKEIGASHEAAQDFEGTVARLDGRIAAAQKVLSESGRTLSRLRLDVAGRIEEAVIGELARLGMANSRFEVRLEMKEDEDGWATDESGRRVTAFEDGVDVAEFYITTNVGEDVRPLARVASGGEISRIMLALKSILARSRRFPILVFDEIDVGISGSVAGKVGETMQDLARHHQIIAITHLPQIAARGDVHLLVEKLVEDGRTKTQIRRLADDHRTRQVAALMSGARVTDAALESAKELMNAGRHVQTAGKPSSTSP